MINAASINECLVVAGLGLYLGASLDGVITRKDFRASLDVSSYLSAAASALLLVLVIVNYPHLGSGVVLDFLGIKLYLDYLSATFLFIISVLGIATSIYTPAYMEHYRRLGMGWLYGVLHSSFILSMALVVLSKDLLTFIFAWEVMTLASYLLIVWERDRTEVLQVGLRYFITMHVLSTLPLLLAIAYVGSKYGTFDVLKLSSMHVSDPVLYALFLLGFGAKAGIVPFHFWLPEAHPAAPSNASALLSGAMIKVAVYGLLRTTCFMLPCSSVFGYVVATIGTVTLVVGTLYALRQTDGKRLLAYHSVGQMGYIWLGIGVGMVFLSLRGAAAAFGVAALAAGLFHAVNHALFKGALFLGAGSILYKAHTRDLNRLGGLARVMPWTALFTVIAALSIAGVPPFNGFLSKWMIYQATFLSMNPYLVFCGIMALFISAATLASFAKFYTAAFGGELREDLGEVREVSPSMLVGQGLLSALCILLGVVPALILTILVGAGNTINASATTYGALSINYFIVNLSPPWARGPLSSYFSPTLFATIVAVSVLALYSAVRGAVPKERVGTWLCGVELARTSWSKMMAKHYYAPFEEGIEGLYHSGEKLHHVAVGVVRSLGRAYARTALSLTSLSRVGAFIPYVPRAYVAVAKALYTLSRVGTVVPWAPGAYEAVAKASAKPSGIAAAIKWVVDTYRKLVKGDIYIDEALWGPLARLVKDLYRVVKGKSFDTISYCLAAAVAFLAVLMIVIHILSGGGP